MRFIGLDLNPIEDKTDQYDFDIEGSNFDWEILFLGKRFLHMRDQNGWSWGTDLESRLTVDPDSKLAEHFEKAIVARKFGNFFAAIKETTTRLVHTTSGAAELRFEGYVWRRSPKVDHPSGKSWSLVATPKGGTDSERVPSTYWGRLDEKVEELEKSKSTQVSSGPVSGARIENPAPPPQTRPQDSFQTDHGRKRTKHGIRIYSSDLQHFFDFGCWPSKKFPGRASIRIGIAGKRKLYTISQQDLDAMLAELRRGRFASPENPPQPPADQHT